MNRDNPTLSWLVWPVFLLVAVPPITAGIFHPGMGILPNLMQSHGIGLMAWPLLLVCYLLPVFCILRWKRLVAGFFLLGFLIQVQATCTWISPSAAKVIFTFGDYGTESGIEVICNDVHLGVTPFEMTEAEFQSKVLPWTAPPEQPVVSFQSDQSGSPIFKNFSHWSWTWTPIEAFRNPFQQPTDHGSYHDPEKLPMLMKTARYWWRFEKDGCLTLRHMDVFSSGGGGSRVIRLQNSLGVSVVAQQKMLELVLASLRAQDYQPSPEWVSFVLKYRDELMSSLINGSEKDPRLADVLDRLADDHFQLPADADLSTSRQALNRAFESVGQKELRDFDWFAGRVALRIVKKYPELLVERAKSEFVSASDLKMFGNRSGNSVLLFNLLSEASPPEIFDLLVYQYGMQREMGIGPMSPGSKLLMAIARSERPEVVPLFRNYLDEIWNKKQVFEQFVHQQDRQESLRVMTHIIHPDLDSQVWQIIGSKIKPDSFNSHTSLQEFIQSRISKSSDLDGLAQQIFRCPALLEKEKGLFLAQINLSQAGQWLREIGDRLADQERETLMDEIGRLPANPACATFMVETWKRAHKLNPGRFQSQWTRALARIDSPVVEELFAEQLNVASPNPAMRWEYMTSQNSPDRLEPGSLAHLDWLVPVLQNIPGNQRFSALMLLREIGTDDARALLQKWADDPNSGVSGNAKSVLEQPSKSDVSVTPIDPGLLATANDLLSGRIKPDSLLPPMPSARWTGETYEAIPALNSR